MAPRGTAVRPTSERAREAIFSVLGERVVDARVLDLCCGTGALGIEALSRGAAHATFVERSAAALAVLRKNLTATAFADRSDVVPANVLAYLTNRLAAPYDLVLCDPPFADVGVLEEVLRRLPEAGAVAPGALAVARVLRKHPPALPAGVRVARTRELGEEDLLFLRYDSTG